MLENTVRLVIGLLVIYGINRLIVGDGNPSTFDTLVNAASLIIACLFASSNARDRFK